MIQGLPLRREWHALPDGTQVSILTGGSATAEPVVLLHGGGTDHAWLSWGEAIPPLLASGYRVIAPDMPGYGQTPPAAWPSTRPNLSRALAELVAEMKLPPATYVGISMGGSLALAQALEYPTRTRALVLVGSYGLARWSPYHQLSVRLARLPTGTNGANAWLARSPLLVRQLIQSMLIFNRSAITPQLVADVQDALTNPATAEAFAQFQRDEIRPEGLATDFRERLPELQLPVLLIHGDRDVGVPLAAVQEAACRIPEATLRVFEGAGHWTQRDQPGRFSYELLHFLGQLPE
ncbi:alpha/beta hydrolase [Deinococcus piscis]|uniref:Alpha/beta hydrolase n=1 Tax=Deinococcus piscis TaxID=394230 RepID=A0ABQ3KB55_9DEIO|nr:alpha/beta hydrolase [Deinococcus piscis]GHG09326.1 alpha/beta hydrolase [Deinococcus piscis]